MKNNKSAWLRHDEGRADREAYSCFIGGREVAGAEGGFRGDWKWVGSGGTMSQTQGMDKKRLKDIIRISSGLMESK